MPHPQSDRNRSRPGRSRHRAVRLGGLLCLAVSVAILGCASDGAPESIPIPATRDLRGAVGLMVTDVEAVEGAPDWAHRSRVEGDWLYGVGIRPGGPSSEAALYAAMREAQRSVSSWLEGQGVRAASPRDLNERLPIPEDRIEFERMAHDGVADRWYVLARFDLAAGRALYADRVTASNATLARIRGRLFDYDSENDERMRAALALLYELDRRAQYQAAMQALGGEPVAIPDALDEYALQEEADDYLSQHGVRILTEGLDVPGLERRIESALGGVHLRHDAFGRGSISVRLDESEGFGYANPYLEIDGFVEVAIEGGDARIYAEPFRVVSTGADVEEARFRASRAIGLEVTRILHTTFRALAESEG